MLEIFGIIWLCNTNKANALKRGRKPGGFIALTLVLWLGLELLGFIIGSAAEWGFGTYLLALCLAIIGGLISYAAARNCKPGQYVSPQQQMASAIVQTAEPLLTPAQIWVVRDSSMVGAMVRWDFTLNGQPIGSLGNGSHLNAAAVSRQNILCAKDAYGTEVAPFVFDAPPGGMIEIHFKANKFLPEQSRGFLPPTQPASAAQMPVAPTPVPAASSAGYGVPTTDQAQPSVEPSAVSADRFDEAVPPTAVLPGAEDGVHAESDAVPLQSEAGFCMQCGARLTTGSDICTQCGAKRFVRAAGNVIPPAGVQPAAGVYPTAAAAGSAAQPGQTATALLPQANTMWALRTGAALVLGWMLFWLVQGIFKYQMSVNADAGYLLTTAMVGVAVYLVLQSSIRDWIAGGILALLSVWMESFNRYIFLILIDDDPVFSFKFMVNGLILLRTALVIGVAVLLAYLLRQQKKSWFFTSAGSAVGTCFLFELIHMLRPLLLPNSSQNHAAFISLQLIRLLITTAVLWLAIHFAQRISRMSRTPVRLRGAGLVWAWLVAVGMSLSLLLLPVWRRSMPMNAAGSVLLALFGAAGYILLLCHKRVGLYVLLAGIGLMLTAQFINSLAYHLHGQQQYAAVWIGSLIGGVNPLLGWLSVRSADRRDAAEQLYRMQMSGAAPALAGGALPTSTVPPFGAAPAFAGGVAQMPGMAPPSVAAPVFAGGAGQAPGMASPFGAAPAFAGGVAQMPGMAPPFAAYAPYGRPTVRPVSAFHKFTAIFNIVTGAFWTLFPVPFMVMGPFHWSMLLIMLLGMLLGGAGIWCFVMQRSRQKAYPTWMRVVSLVFFILSALVLLAILIRIISYRLQQS